MGLSLEDLGGFRPAFEAIAGGYGFANPDDALDRLVRANALLEAPVPLIAVALALPPHDPEVDELVAAYAEPDLAQTPPPPTDGPTTISVEMRTSDVLLVTVRGHADGLHWRSAGGPVWIPVTVAAPGRMAHRFLWDQMGVGPGEAIDLGLSFGTGEPHVYVSGLVRPAGEVAGQ